MESVDKFSTESVDKSPITACFVKNVEKLSTENVDNSLLLLALWKVWKSYPPKMWINRLSLSICGKCGKVIHKKCG